MTRRMQENILATALLLFFLAALAMSFGYGPRSRLVPLPIAALGAMLVIAQLVWQNTRVVDDLQVDVFEFLTGRSEDTVPEAAAEAQSNSKKEAPSGFHRELAGCGIVLALLAMFLILGPVPASFLFTVGYFRGSREFGWTRSMLYGAVFTAFIYVMFGRVLGVDLNRGLIAPALNTFFYF
jgi:hypothetical protein